MNWMIEMPDLSWRAIRVWQRNRDVFKKLWLPHTVGNLLDPIFYLLALGIGLGAYVGRIQGMSYIEFIAPGLVAATTMITVSFECTYGSYTRMATQRTFDAIIATPLSIEDVIGGELLWGTTKGVVAGLAVTAVAAAFGLISLSVAALVLPVLFIEGLLFSATSLIVTAVSPNYDFFNYYWTLFLSPLFFFSGVFFPLEAMPGWVQAAAWFFPLTHFVRMARDLSSGTAGASTLLALLVLTLVSLLLSLLAINLIKRRLIK